MLIEHHKLFAVFEEDAAQKAVVARTLPAKMMVAWNVLHAEICDMQRDQMQSPEERRRAEFVAAAKLFGNNAINMLSTESDLKALDTAPVMQAIHRGNAMSIGKPVMEVVHNQMVANDIGAPVPFMVEAPDYRPVRALGGNVIAFRSPANRAA